ncbi:MAG: hypothetical protein B6245_07980 [Desulfobacteraceae bacterium 4572_88]|nr:MAG: hypothetical protein B6245_07980 [Desulfobacteraceae bacterium 4572_88]
MYGSVNIRVTGPRIFPLRCRPDPWPHAGLCPRGNRLKAELRTPENKADKVLLPYRNDYDGRGRLPGVGGRDVRVLTTFRRPDRATTGGCPYDFNLPESLRRGITRISDKKED